MRTWLTYIWDSFKSNFGVIPALILLIGIAAGMFLPSLEIRADGLIARWLPYSLSAESDKRLLESMIGILASVSGVVFSVSMLVIAQASSQFGPRIIRIFTDQQITQWTLGAFLGTTLYCLLVLWQIPSHQSPESQTPGSVLLGLACGLASLLLLICYIYAVAEMMQVQRVIRDIAHDLDQSIQRLFPEDDDGEQSKHEEEASCDFQGGQRVFVASQGYIQAIAYEGLAHLATEHDLRMRLTNKPGDFVTREDPVVFVHGTDELTPELQSEISGLILTGNQRTPRQDVQCAVRELVEIALRALSPGINDPHTAMSCIDYLGATLSRLSERGDQKSCYFDDDDVLRLYAPRDSFIEAFRTAFDQIRLYGSENPQVIMAVLRAMNRIANSMNNPAHREIIQSEAKILEKIITTEWPFSQDRQPALQLFEQLQLKLSQP